MPSKSVALKLKHCHKAYDEMLMSQVAVDKDRFEFYFGAFLGNAGALRLFLRQESRAGGAMAETWFGGLEADADFAAITGLRNSDVHDETVVSPQQRFDVKLYANLGGGPEKPTETTVEYHLDPTKLPGDFMTAPQAIKRLNLKQGDPLPERPAALANLRSSSIITIAKRYLSIIGAEITNAVAKGYIS